MELPAFTPPELSHYAEAADETALLQRLIEAPAELVLFLEIACEDETWSDVHSSFMREAFLWLTDQHLQERLSPLSARRISSAIHEHYRNLYETIPYNLTLQTGSYQRPANSLLLSISSPVLHDMVRFRERDNNTVLFKDLSSEDIDRIVECSHSENVQDLWKNDREALFRILQQATQFNIPRLMELCQDVLKRYIQRENAVKLLFLAHQEPWAILEQHVIDFLNAHARGICLSLLTEDIEWQEENDRKALIVEFLDFGDASLDLFEQIKPLVTHLVFGSSLTEESSFPQVMKCQNLVSVNVSHTRKFSEFLRDIPEMVHELDLSRCPWLTPAYLKQLVEQLPLLKKIRLGGNTQLAFSAWNELKKLTHLKALDISYCTQIDRETVLLLIKICPHIVTLDMAGCNGLSTSSFFEIARGWPQLSFLNLSYCNVTDAVLLEIALRCKYLRTLLLKHCPDITLRGVLQLTQQATSLQVLDISETHIPASAIQQVRPNLNLRGN